ncbi:MAG: hypothetical protein CRN43_13525 [Candidatus Nephrothrix sp. EaCA]|nr:MAG: hypothetical protein CRN43_13525 [Candidatus Nephrothrix sp. EaCA]
MLIAGSKKAGEKRNRKNDERTYYSNSASNHGNKMKGIKKGKDKEMAACTWRQFEDRRQMFFFG